MKKIILLAMFLIFTKASAQVVDIPVCQLLDSNLNIECGLFANYIVSACHDSIPHTLDINFYCQDQGVIIELTHDNHIEEYDTIIAPSSKRNFFVMIDSHNNHFFASSNGIHLEIPMAIIDQRNIAKFIIGGSRLPDDLSYPDDDDTCNIYWHYIWANGHLTKID